jgi:NAD(P)-dependent dehydrogenase (short-subunit alcohol dehydrogenase family)
MYERVESISITKTRAIEFNSLTIAFRLGILAPKILRPLQIGDHKNMQSQSRTALVTGGNGGLGSVVVQAFFDAGCNLAVPVHQSSDVPPLADRYSSGRVFVSEADLNSEPKVRTFVSQVRDKFGSIQYLVNIAGGYAGGNSIDQVSLDEWERMLTLNLRTAFLTCRAVLPIMRRQKYGRIANISAMPALTTGANKGPYAISKRGVIALTEIIADETKGTGITANAIAPSIIVTESNRKSMPGADVSKWVTPDEIAHLVLFLCSDQARSISGNTIRIFGGV